MPIYRTRTWKQPSGDGSPVSCHRWGLTLLELLVVVAILGLVMAIVAVRANRPQEKAMLGQAVSQWEFADGQLRLHAWRTAQPTALRFDLGSNRLQCEFGVESDESKSTRTLGRGVRLAKFLSPTRELSRGPVVIQFTDRGTSETYAIQIQGAGNEERWILVAGVSGQISEVHDEQTAQRALEILLPPGIHSG